MIFSKYVIYNQVLDTYDARHNRMSEEQFREYIRRRAEIQMERWGNFSAAKTVIEMINRKGCGIHVF